MMKEMVDKSIKVTKSTYQRLKEKGKMGESFDKVINKIIDETEKIKNKKG